MINQKKVLAIIPARGGSKGLPFKNILDLGGMPLIAWTIKAAKNSNYIDRVILSSDDEEICNVAKHYGCEVPFVRPKELASDTADSVSVIMHALQLEGDSFDIIMLLQPTSPFRNECHIDDALERFIQTNATTLVGVCELEKSPEWLFYINSNHTLSRLLPNCQNVSRRQDSKKAYFLNGALYIFDKSHFIENQNFSDEETQAILMDARSSIDIDTREDLNYARFTIASFKHD